VFWLWEIRVGPGELLGGQLQRERPLSRFIAMTARLLAVHDADG
jgi:hypothetical protein